MNATSARKPRVVITAIAQCGKEDDPSEPCKPDPPNPLPCDVVAVDTPVEANEELIEASEDESAAAEEDSAAEDDDMAASTELANVVSVAQSMNRYYRDEKPILDNTHAWR